MIDLQEARAALPLPALLARLGHGDSAKQRGALCPLHEDKKASFSVFHGTNGRWQWKCFSGCGNGDEVELLQKLENLSPADAIKRYGELAGANGKTIFVRAGNSHGKQASIDEASRIFDGTVTTVEPAPKAAVIAPLTPAGIQKLSEWRGYSLEFAQEIAAAGVIGVYDSCYAFPVSGGVHYRVKGGGWRYSPGAKASLLMLGEIGVGRFFICESSWDALAIYEYTRKPVVCTRGAANVAPLIEFIGKLPTQNRIIAFAQNDAPGQKWLESIATKVNCPILSAQVPTEYKDINELTKALGKSCELEVDMAIANAKEISVAPTEAASAEVVQSARITPAAAVKPVASSARDGNEERKAGASPRPPKSVSLSDQPAQASPDRAEAGSSPAAPESFPASVPIEPPYEASVVVISTKDTQGREAQEGTCFRQRPSAAADSCGGEPICGDGAQPAGESLCAMAAAATGGSSAPPAEPLPVPVLADGGVNAQIAQESTPQTTTTAPVGPDSCGGQDLSSLADILASIETYLKRYVVFPVAEQVPVIALWCVHAHCYEAFRFSPYLHVCSPEKRCGKTRLLECIQLLVPRPRAFVRPSEAVLFRTIEKERPTLLLDEIDTIFGKEADESAEALRGILNAGFQKGGTVPRCEANGKSFTVVEFSVFSPKIIAGIGKIPDTVRDRSLEIRLVRQTNELKAERFRQVQAEEESAPIRSALSAWAKGAADGLARACPELPEQLSDRQMDMTEPLLAIADMAGEGWAKRGRDAIIALCSVTEDQSPGVQLLSCIRVIFAAKDRESVTSTDLINALISVEEANAPWVGWWEADVKRQQMHGPQQKLARMLEPYGIKPAKMGDDFDDNVKGYHRADFADAWRRYLQPITGSVTMDLPF